MSVLEPPPRSSASPAAFPVPPATHHALPKLAERLKSTARVRMLSWLCVGLGLAAACVIAAFSIFSIIDLTWHLSIAGRCLAVALTGLCAAALFLAGVWRAWNQSRDLNREALAVQVANPHLGNALSASLLYGADAELTRRESSPAIVDRLIHATHQDAQRATFVGAVSWRMPKIYALVALSLFLCAVIAAQANLRIFSLTWSRFLYPWADLPAPTWTALGAVGPYGTPQNHWKIPAGQNVTISAEVLQHDPGEAWIETRTAESPWLKRKMYRLNVPAGSAAEARYGYDLDNLLQDVEYRVLCGDAQTAKLAIPVAVDPELADLEVTVTPPAFLHRPPTVLQGIGDVDALAGSVVEVRARANTVLRSGELRFLPDAPAAVAATTGTPSGPAPGAIAIAPAAADHPAVPAAAMQIVPGLVGATSYADACDAALRAQVAAARATASGSAPASDATPVAPPTVPIGATNHDFTATFPVRVSGHYTLVFHDRDGKPNADELRYLVHARENLPPKVRITAPARDVSVKNDATVPIDLVAEDDFGLREVGVYVMIDHTIERKTLKRPADGTTALRLTYDLDLANHGFQGGEVITYWAFAVDEDGTPQGREVASPPQFLMTFAENNYAQQNQPKQKMSPQSKKSVLALDQLIQNQKDEVTDTFGLYQQMGLHLNRADFAKAAGADGPAAPATNPPTTTTTPAPTGQPATTTGTTAGTTATATAIAPPPDATPDQVSRVKTLADRQTHIQSDLNQLIADVKEELQKLQAEQAREGHPGHPGQSTGPTVPPGPDGPGGTGGPGGPGGTSGGGTAGGGGPAPAQFTPKELQLMEQAAATMNAVQPPLTALRPDKAVKPEDEALRLMSEARKLVLSKNGSGQMKIALQGAQRKQQQRDQEKQDEQAQQTADQMRKLPPMLNDLDELDDEAKKLEKHLNDQQQPPATAQNPQTHTPANQGQTADQQKADQQKKEDENRRLARKQQQAETQRLQNQFHDHAQELANRAKETADRLRDMNRTAADSPQAQQDRDQAAEQLENSARRLDQAGRQANQAQTPQAAQAAQQQLADARQGIKQAAQRLDQSLQNQNRHRLDQAVQDAQSLEERQKQLAQDTAAAQQNQAKAQAQGHAAPQTQTQNQPQPGQPQPAQPGQSQANPTQPNAQQTPGQPSAQAEQTAANLAHEQRSIADDLTALRERLNELGDQLDQNAPPQSAQAQAAQDLHAAAKQAESRSDIQRDINNAAKDLQNGGFAKAQEKQTAAEQGMAGLRQQIQQAQAHDAGAARAELSRAIDAAAELHRQLGQAAEAAQTHPAPGQPAPATPAEMAAQAADLARQLNDLAGLDPATRRAAADAIQKAEQTLAQAGAQKDAATPQHLNAAADRVADATQQLQHGLQDLDANQLHKTADAVDRTLHAQHAADDAMQTAADAKQAQAAAAAAAAAQAKNAGTPAAGTPNPADKTAQAEQAAAHQADQAAGQAAQAQTTAAKGAAEINQALQRLQTYFNAGQTPNPAQPTPPAAANPELHQLVNTLGDRFAQANIPDATRSLAGKVAELKDQESAAQPAPGAPTSTTPPQTPQAPAQPAMAPAAAAQRWQDHRATGAQVEANLADVKQRLDQIQAAVDQDQLKRLEAARQAVQQMMHKLDPNAPAGNPTTQNTPGAQPQAGAQPQKGTQPQPGDKPQQAHQPETPADPSAQPAPGTQLQPAAQPVTAGDLKHMVQDLGQLKGDLGRLELDAKTLHALDQAGAQLKQALEQSAAPQAAPQATSQAAPPPGAQPDPTGKTPKSPGTVPGQPEPHSQPNAQPNAQPAPATQDANFATRPGAKASVEQLKFVRGGLDRAIARVLADRRIAGEQDDQAPRQYNALVDKYFERLSDEQIEKGADRR